VIQSHANETDEEQWDDQGFQRTKLANWLEEHHKQEQSNKNKP